jgi:hypothetical protein
MGFLIVLVLLAWAAWVVFTQVGARQQITISTEHDVAAARKMVAASFNVVWTRVKGRGQENFRPKLRMHAPVLSVDYQSADGGGSSVHIWCSDYKTKFGLMAHAQLMWRKKRAVARALNPPGPVGPAALASPPEPASLAVPARPKHEAPREVSAGANRETVSSRQPDRPAHRAQETDWSVPSFFTKNPISIPEPTAAPGRIPEAAAAPGRDRWPHPESDPLGYGRHLDEILDGAEAGDAASDAYVKGLGAKSQGDVASALRYYEKAAQLGLVDAMYDAGCVNSDLGRTSASTYWWEAAARRGHAQSAYNLGVLAFRAGDLNAARLWYQKAAELGDGGGCAALTQMAAEAGDKQAEMHWSRLGADLGHPFCLMRYGQLLMQANPNDRTVMEQALVLEERAAQTGDADAMFLAGVINGQLGRRPEARWWLEQAESAGIPRARSVIDRYGL